MLMEDFNLKTEDYFLFFFFLLKRPLSGDKYFGNQYGCIISCKLVTVREIRRMNPLFLHLLGPISGRES